VANDRNMIGIVVTDVLFLSLNFAAIYLNLFPFPLTPAKWILIGLPIRAVDHKKP
jgi:hypothetical protein